MSRAPQSASAAGGVASLSADSRPIPPAPFDWPAVFGNDRPVEMEVGFGKGLFLLTPSRASPTSTSSASRSFASISSSRATRWPSAALTNVRVACADARLFLRDCVAAGVAAGGARLFPRSVVEEAAPQAAAVHGGFAAQAIRVLRPGGRSARRHRRGGLFPA